MPPELKHKTKRLAPFESPADRSEDEDYSHEERKRVYSIEKICFIYSPVEGISLYVIPP